MQSLRCICATTYEMKQSILIILSFAFMLGCEGGDVTKRTDHSGYKGSVALWKEVLTCWQEEMSSEIVDANFSFADYDGRGDVRLLKERYPNLPRSYLDFVEAGGPHLRSIDSGWIEEEGVNRGFPSFIKAADVDLMKESDSYPEWHEIAKEWRSEVLDKNYFSYTGSMLDFNAPEFGELLLVGHEASSTYKAVYLINPLHVSVDGEWEGWYWYPASTGGARRFPSFAHLAAQKYIYDRFLLDNSREILLYFDESDWGSLCLSKVLEKNW